MVKAKAFAVVLGGLLALPGCSGGSSPAAPAAAPTPTAAPPPVRSVIQSGSCSDIGVNILCAFTPFTTTQKGDLDITVDWTFPQDSIQIFVSSGTCTLEQINGSQCTYVASTPTASTLPKPKVLTAKGAAAGTYRVYVGNRGPNTESASIQVGLTTGGTSSSRSTGVAVQRDDRAYASQVTAH